MNKRTQLLALALAFHLVYLWAIFDIYFVSPLVHGMPALISTPSAPAKRLFLIVGDGQRADKTFGTQKHPDIDEELYLAPFLRSIVLNEGTYGLSHTRMPTESRPGHVAMIAGFYEDVSAVTKGWKENPVDFDSVFNRSSHTYSFGSPDILPMFAQGATPGKIDTWMYGHEFEDFTSSSIELDKFVFDHLDQLFLNSTKDFDLHEQIHQEGNIFFLHLLGTDTSGHGYRPYSAEYYDNIAYTDRKIKELVPKVNDFFGDEETVFIFTADHGMSDFGSHGDGHPNNTRTPLICWGKGCNKPKYISPAENEFLLDSFEAEDMANWEFDHIQRNDVNQADIAPLMSYLLGLEYPVNSVGELPLAFIDDTLKSKVKGLYINSLALLQQYLVKENEVKSHEFKFKPFPAFIDRPIESYQKSILKSIELNDNPVKQIEDFNSIILQGLDYYQKYNWLMLRSIVTLGFIGWIIYSFILFLQLFVIPKEDQQFSFSVIYHLIFGSIGLLTGALFYYQDSPFNYYLYLLFPTFFWGQIFTLKQDLYYGFNLFFKGLSKISILGIFVATISIFEFIAIGFTTREVFSIMYLVLAVYPIVLFKGSNKRLSIAWFINCVLLSIFPIQDPVKTESLNMIISSGIIMTLVGIVGYSTLKSLMSKQTSNVIKMQLSLLLITIYSLSKSIISLSNKQGLPRNFQVINWCMLFGSLVLPIILHCIFPNSDYRVRFLIVFLTLGPTFLILTISFETFFYILFSSLIYQWILIEGLSITKSYFQLIRISLIGFFSLQISFFGTGNVSSISSFSLDSVYRLLPIFDPFPMGALLMLKLIIPYVLLSVGLGLLNIELGLQKYSITTLVICIVDLLSLWFFYQVRTEGSWLMIGVSISNYILAIFGAMFIGLVELGSSIILAGVVEVAKENPAINKKVEKVLEDLKVDDISFSNIVKEDLVGGDDDDAPTGGIAKRVRNRVHSTPSKQQEADVIILN